MNNLWILLVLIPMLPVALHMFRDHSVYSSDEAGPLLQGRASLDSLLEASRGSTVLLNFWATWCTPCVEELPRIDMLYTSMGDSVVAIAVDLGDPDIETLVFFRQSLQLSMPMVWLSEEDARALKSDWTLPDLFPVTVFLDPNGEEYLRVSGARDRDFFVAAIRSGSTGIDLSNGSDEHLHINVVGYSDDPATIDIMEFSLELAGSSGVELFDPAVPADLEAMRSLYLPETGYPYAQPCIGTACGRPAFTREELLLYVEVLSQ
jgi:thiol-disulfide isomerase/thioredoxin